MKIFKNRLVWPFICIWVWFFNLGIEVSFVHGWSLKDKELLQEQWLEHFLHGKKVGYMQIQIFQGYMGQMKVLEVISSNILRVNRGEHEVTVESRISSLSTADFKPLEFLFTKKIDQQDENIRGRVINGRLKTESIPGDKALKSIDLPPNTIFNSLLEMYVRQKGGVRKEIFTLPVIMEELGNVVEIHLEVNSERVKKNKLPKTLIKGKVLGIDFLERLDSKGRIVINRMDSIGMESRQSKKKQANKFENLLNIVNWSLIKPDRKLPDPSGISFLRIKITSQNGHLPSIPRNRCQLVTMLNSGTAMINLSRGSSKCEPALLDRQDRQKYISASRYEQVDDQRIKTTVKKIVGGIRGEQAARKILSWVYLYINKKNLQSAYSSALEVLQSRQGDCTEHSILFSSLVKALGIPARIVNGLVYYQDSFGYHEWVEIYLNGGWRGVDPALNQWNIDATHIKLTQGGSNDKAILMASLKLAKILTRIKIEILGYKCGDDSFGLP